MLLLREKLREFGYVNNLQLPDALQVAAAIIAGCEAFLTNDAALKRVTKLRVLVVCELESQNP